MGKDLDGGTYNPVKQSWPLFIINHVKYDLL